MKFCSKTSTLAALVLTAVPIWAKPNIRTLADQCSQGPAKACRELEGALDALAGQCGQVQIAPVSLTDYSALMKAYSALPKACRRSWMRRWTGFHSGVRAASGVLVSSWRGPRRRTRMPASGSRPHSSFRFPRRFDGRHCHFDEDLGAGSASRCPRRRCS